MTMLQQAFQFQKNLCNSTFTIATSVQENCENILKESMDMTPWMPQQGKKIYLYMSEQYWLGLNKYKKASLSQIDYLESLTQLSEPQKKQPVKPAAKQTPAKAKATPKRSSGSSAKSKTVSTAKPKSTSAPKSKSSTPTAGRAKKTTPAKKTTVKSAAPKTTAAKPATTPQKPEKQPGQESPAVTTPQPSASTGQSSQTKIAPK